MNEAARDGDGSHFVSYRHEQEYEAGKFFAGHAIGAWIILGAGVIRDSRWGKDKRE